MKQNKLTQAGTSWTTLTRKASDDTPEKQRELFESLWEQGGFAPIHGNYSDFSTEIYANHLFYNFWREKVRERLSRDDPELLENLAPSHPPYPFGTKRPSLETSFYNVFNQEKVSLVNLNKNPVQEVRPDGVRMRDGSFIKIDALILATGFDAVTGGFSRINIRGSKNKALNDEWSTGTRTLFGMATSRLPHHALPLRPQEPRRLRRRPRPVRDPGRLDHPHAHAHAAARAREDRGEATWGAGVGANDK